MQLVKKNNVTLDVAIFDDGKKDHQRRFWVVRWITTPFGNPKIESATAWWNLKDAEEHYQRYVDGIVGTGIGRFKRECPDWSILLDKNSHNWHEEASR